MLHEKLRQLIKLKFSNIPFGSSLYHPAKVPETAREIKLREAENRGSMVISTGQTLWFRKPL
jgi:hypothetical protein